MTDCSVHDNFKDVNLSKEFNVYGKKAGEMLKEWNTKK